MFALRLGVCLSVSRRTSDDSKQRGDEKDRTWLTHSLLQVVAEAIKVCLKKIFTHATQRNLWWPETGGRYVAGGARDQSGTEPRAD
jgi:hypothetical protein